MKATGEVMAIDRSFEAALHKAVRSLELGVKCLLWEDPAWQNAKVENLPLDPTDLRLWAVFAALRKEADVSELAKITHIDPWFLHGMQRIAHMYRRLTEEKLDHSLLQEAKSIGVKLIKETFTGKSNLTKDKVRTKRILEKFSGSTQNIELSLTSNEERSLVFALLNIDVYFNLSIKYNEPHHLADSVSYTHLTLPTKA